MTHSAPRGIRSDAERFLTSKDGQLSLTDLGGLHIDPQELSELIVDHGQGCELRRAQLCPCIRPETGQPRGNCPSCRGLRFLHPTGDTYREGMVALILSQQLQREFRNAGVLVTGTVRVLFPLGVLPGEGDLLLPDQEEHVVHERLIRDDRPVRDSIVRSRETSASQAAPKTVPFRERLLYPDLTMVESVWYWDDGEGRSFEATEGHDYKPGFPDGVVRWHPGRGPKAGEAYSVRYRAPAAYMLEPAQPMFRSEHNSVFPYSVTAQRLDQWSEARLDYDRSR